LRLSDFSVKVVHHRIGLWKAVENEFLVALVEMLLG